MFWSSFFQKHESSGTYSDRNSTINVNLATRKLFASLGCDLEPMQCWRVRDYRCLGTCIANVWRPVNCEAAGTEAFKWFWTTSNVLISSVENLHVEEEKVCHTEQYIYHRVRIWGDVMAIIKRCQSGCKNGSPQMTLSSNETRQNKQGLATKAQSQQAYFTPSFSWRYTTRQ